MVDMHGTQLNCSSEKTTIMNLRSKLDGYMEEYMGFGFKKKNMPPYVSGDKLGITPDTKSLPFMPTHEFVLTYIQTSTYTNTSYTCICTHTYKMISK